MGPRLARQLVTIVPDGCPGMVVELGAGTGVLSVLIRDRLGPGARHLAVELDDDLFAYLRMSKPWLGAIRADAIEYDRLLDDAGIEKVDVVISSLPWALWSPRQCERLLTSIAARLTPNGVFGTITTRTALPGRVRELRTALHGAFGEVVETATVWRNVPPAGLFLGRQPYQPY